MENRNELITAKQMLDFLTKEVENGNGDKYVFVGESFVSVDKPVVDGHIYFGGIHAQEVLDYGDETGDVINC